ncbi:MAG: ferrochelatase, partial [Myxococcales bacterium]|nr:ferrochelatase [Myxococcales bacterium]
DLEAFVTNVRRGAKPAPALVEELRGRYRRIGGSPLNATNARLAEKLERQLGLPVRWANRLWKPYVAEVLRELREAGTERVAVVPLAQYSAHVYEADARRAAEGTGLSLACAANWGQTPALHAAYAARITAVLGQQGDPSRATVLMTAHSLPRSVIAAGDPYEAEVRAAAEAIAAIVRQGASRPVRSAVAFQSQGLSDPAPGARRIEWLGPDLASSLDAVAAEGASGGVVFAPIGFLADHVEILYDLDVEARALCAARGLAYARAASLNDDDDLVDVLAAVARPLLGA